MVARLENMTGIRCCYPQLPVELQFYEDVQRHGRVAILPSMPVTLNALKPKQTDFRPSTLGDHIRKRRLELGLSQKETARRY